VAIVTKGWVLDACVTTAICLVAFYGAYQVAMRGFPYLVTTGLPGCYVAFYGGPDARRDVIDPALAGGLTLVAVGLTLLVVIVILHTGIVLTRVYLHRRRQPTLLPCSKPAPPGVGGMHG
jgi:hypothetical protein